MRQFLRLALLVPLLLLATCAGRSATGPGGTGEPGSQLPAGRAFVSTAVTQGGAPKQLVAGTRVELRFFDAARLVLTAGCNSMDGTARLGGDRLIVADLSTTEMGCAPEAHKQDEWLAAFLAAEPAWQLSGDELVLIGGDIELRLADRKTIDPDRPLVGTTWVVDTILAGEAASSVPAGVQAYLTVDAEGAVTGSTGCNSFGGKATVADGRLALADVVSTKKACGTAATGLERTVLRVLAQPMTYRIEANRLTLTGSDGSGLRLIG